MSSIQQLVDGPALLLLVVANSTPVMLARVLGSRYAAPVDANRLLHDGRPLFGPHKTWRGVISGTAAAGLTAALLEQGFILGALFGAMALAGDLLSSFLKRRLGCASGRSLLFLDQLPEALLPMIILRGTMGLDAIAIVGTAALFTLFDVMTARLRE